MKTILIAFFILCGAFIATRLLIWVIGYEEATLYFEILIAMILFAKWNKEK